MVCEVFDVTDHQSPTGEAKDFKNLCLPKLKTQSTLDMRKDAPASAQAGACKADEKIYFYMNLIYLYRKNIYIIYYRNE